MSHFGFQKDWKCGAKGYGKPPKRGGANAESLTTETGPTSTSTLKQYGAYLRASGRPCAGARL